MEMARLRHKRQRFFFLIRISFYKHCGVCFHCVFVVHSYDHFP